MRRGTIFEGALKWMALVGMVLAVGAVQVAAQDGRELELTIRSVSIGGSTASEVEVRENSVVDVVVTLNAALPNNPDNDATGTPLTLPINVTATNILASGSEETGMAEDGDVQIDGSDLTAAARTALRTFDEGESTVRFRIEFDEDPDAVHENFTLTVALGALAGGNGTASGNPEQTEVSIEQVGGANVTKSVEIMILDNEEQDYKFDILTEADDRREDAAVIMVELEADPPRPPAEDVEVQLFLESDAPGIARRYEIGRSTSATAGTYTYDSDSDEHTFDESAEGAVYEIGVRLRQALANSDSDRGDDTITLEADLVDPNHRRLLTVEQEIVVKDIHGLPASNKITAKAYMDDDGDPDDDEAMSMMEGGDPVHVTVTVDRGKSGFPLNEQLEVVLVAADPDQRLDFRFPDGGNKLTIDSGMDKKSDTIKLEALEDRDVGPENLVLNLMVTGKDDDNGPGEVMGQPFSIAIEDATPKLVWPKDGWEEAVKASMGGDPEGDPPHTLNPGMDFMLMGGNLFEPGMIPVDITYSASVEGDAASVRVRLFCVGGPERVHGVLRLAWQELLDPSKAG